MTEQVGVVPIAAAVAIALFIARELIELIKRSRADGRKRSAIRALLIAECERNHFAILRMLDQIESIEIALATAGTIHVTKTSTGRDVIEFRSATGAASSSSPVPHVHHKVVDKYLFDAASLDSKLFGLMERVLSTTAAMEHVREGIIYYPVEDVAHLDGFGSFATRELGISLDEIRALYLHCANEPLTKKRVR